MSVAAPYLVQARVCAWIHGLSDYLFLSYGIGTITFIEKIRMVVLGKLKHMGQPSQPGAQPGAAGGGQPGPPSGGPPPGGPAAAPPPGAAQAPPQGGPAPHPNIPGMDPDEMRRVIAQTTGS